MRLGASLSPNETAMSLVPVEPEKNLHASVPPSLLSQAENAARAEKITLDELVRDAVERRLHRTELEEVLSFGKRHASQRGLVPGDIANAVAEVRGQENEQR